MAAPKLDHFPLPGEGAPDLAIMVLPPSLPKLTSQGHGEPAGVPRGPRLRAKGLSPAFRKLQKCTIATD